jgi:hypothetical protein
MLILEIKKSNYTRRRLPTQLAVFDEIIKKISDFRPDTTIFSIFFVILHPRMEFPEWNSPNGIPRMERTEFQS